MKFKAKDIQRQFMNVNPRLIALLYYIEHYALKEHGIEITVTSLIRDDGVHACSRGADIRVWNFTEPQRTALRDHINGHFPYDDSRPNLNTCVYGTDKAHQDHFHLQVKHNG